MERINAWKTYENKDKKELEQLNQDYIEFLSVGKTERECVKETIRQAEQNGYQPLEEVLKKGEKLQKGDKVYAAYMNKTIALFQIGEKPLEEGMNILGAHIDSPRMDVKQNPLYESDDMAYLDTHYYGGIKKYQWVTLPLAIHGVIVKKDGTSVDVSIGEKTEVPVFCVTDLLDPSGRSTDGEEGGKGDRGREVRYSCRKYAFEGRGEGCCQGRCSCNLKGKLRHGGR